MSDEIVYASKFGRITILSSAGGDALNTPDEVDQQLAVYANMGTRLDGKLYVLPGSFVLLKSCLQATTSSTCDVSGAKLGVMSLEAIQDARTKLLDFATDDQLRAECERRWRLRHLAEFIEYDGDVMTAAVAMGAAPPQSPEAAAFRARMDDPVPRSKYASHRELEVAQTHLVVDIEKAKTERDEWKRRAQTAEAKLSDKDTAKALYAMWSGESRPRYIDRHEFARMVERDERGPGIAATKPSDEHWCDPWDFLEDA